MRWWWRSNSRTYSERHGELSRPFSLILAHGIAGLGSAISRMFTSVHGNESDQRTNAILSVAIGLTVIAGELLRVARLRTRAKNAPTRRSAQEAPAGGRVGGRGEWGGTRRLLHKCAAANVMKLTFPRKNRNDPRSAAGAPTTRDRQVAPPAIAGNRSVSPPPPRGESRGRRRLPQPRWPGA